MQQLLLVFHVLVCAALVILVLLQQGKGAEMGAAFGSGASQTLFGSQGSGSFLMKITGICAALFFITSLSLGYLAAHQNKQDVLQNIVNVAAQVPVQTQAGTATTSNNPQSQIPQDQVPQQKK
jgi:preprotein translocase subunit SecG